MAHQEFINCAAFNAAIEVLLRLLLSRRDLIKSQGSFHVISHASSDQPLNAPIGLNRFKHQPFNARSQELWSHDPRCSYSRRAYRLTLDYVDSSYSSPKGGIYGVFVRRARNAGTMPEWYIPGMQRPSSYSAPNHDQLERVRRIYCMRSATFCGYVSWKITSSFKLTRLYTRIRGKVGARIELNFTALPNNRKKPRFMILDHFMEAREG
ncbi:hypothetical protein B0H16DRAFT_1450064 [Mycena metata]|uniref:Uncharacterized protein n=1 Tax=Mycena metata TaxID=1033252 RepID=A0AAD7NTM9_9AGAR|nr:hypothetical protein B0H16DRAFT_1450064 [Mycena metata]